MAASKENTALFNAKLQEEISGSADTAATSLERLKTRLDDDTKALAKMNAAMKAMQKGDFVNATAYRKLDAAIKAKKASLEQARVGYINFGGTFSEVAKKMKKPLMPTIPPIPKEPENALASLGKEATELGGPLGRVGQLLTHAVKAAKAHPILAVAAALALVGVAAYKTGRALYDYATAQSNAHRAEKLRLEGLSKIRTYHSIYMGLAETSAKDLGASVDRVSGKVSVGREKLLEYTSQLYQAGLRGKQLDSALEGMAMKSSAQGEEQAQLFKGWATYYALSGRNVDKLTERVRSRLGGIVKAQMLDATVQAQKLEESYAALFRGIDDEPLLKAKAEVNALFSQTTATGRGMKTLLTGIVQPFVDMVTKTQPFIKRFYQGLVYGALKVDIAFIQIKKAWRKVFGVDATSELDLSKAMFWAVATAVIAIGGAAWIASAAFKVFAGMIKLTYEETKKYVEAFGWFGGKIAESGKALFGGAKGLGEQVWKGLAEGINSGDSPVRASIAELGKSAQQELADGLVIRSPSLVFEKLGRAVPAGFALGIKAGQGEPQAAVADMVQLPKSAPGAGPGKSQSMSVSVGEVHVHLEGGKSASAAGEAKAIGAAVKQELERILQGVAFELGAPA